jgi:hypothetical protein
MNILPSARVLLLATLLLGPVAAFAGEFARSLTPEKMQAAGLAKLTPGELGELEALVELYKAGALEKAAALAPAPTAPAAPATATETPEAKSKKLMPDWIGALITMKRVESQPTNKSQALESRLAGEFRGWSGQTNFKLENGQIWATAHKGDSYVYTPALQSPKVKIKPGAMGTFWLEIEGVNQRVRVRPIRLE